MAGWTCAGCAGANPDGTLFCGHCGTRREEVAEGWSCRECGSTNAPEMAFCGRCGTQQAVTRQEELRLVTALFADISGFTTLADQLDVESLHEVIHPLVGGLARIAEKYEGFVEKYAGDAVLVLYGAPVTHEDDPQRALLAALEMHASLPRLLADIGPAAAGLTIHIGVNTGRVLAGQTGSEQQSDYSVLGDSVILAQRLESVCPSGQTYVGETTYELTRNEFDFESVGELQLKGKLKPVTGYRLLGRRRADSSVQRPLVGRTREMAVVDSALDRVADGRSVALTVSGEPGCGKSRLLAEVRSRATARGMRWLPARCLSYGSSLPYWPIADLLRQGTGARFEDDPETVHAKLEAALPTETLPAARRLLGLPVGPATPEQVRRDLHDAIATWLGVFSAGAPTVLMLEDVHWADSGTLDVLGEIIRTRRDVPLAVAVSTRPEGLPALDAMCAGSVRHHLDVLPLDAEAIRDLVAGLLTGPASPGLAELLVSRTGGNPLFVEELTRSLHETESLVETSQGWETVPGFSVDDVPETVERVFAARLDVLPPAAASLLQTTAVIGRSVRMSLLRAVAAPDPVDEPLAVLVEAGLLDRGLDSDEPAVTFHHALLQDVVYGRLLRKRRRELHRRVADVGRSLYGDGDENVDLMARHLYLAEAEEEAIEPALRAGRRAAALYANESAVVHLERAVELLERFSPDERLDEARLELARVQELRGVYDEAYRLYELRRLSDGDPRAWRGVMAVQRSRGEYDEALRVFGEATRALDPRNPSSGAVWVEAGWTLALVGRPSDAVSVIRTALRFLGDADRTLRAQLLCQLVDAERMLGHIDDAVMHANEAVSLADPVTDVETRAMALRTLGATYLDAERLDEAIPALREALAAAERIGALDEAAGCLLNLCMIALAAGDSHTAVECADAAMLRFEKLDHKSGRAVSYCNLADALRAEGRLEQALYWADQALTYAREIGHGMAEADALRTRAQLSLMRGDVDAARVDGVASAVAFTHLEAVQEAQSAWAIVADAARAAGDLAGVEVAERESAALVS
jgi:class 3 adenylate cyclase/tetratricopeptide (TPR) repeat protein